MAETKWKLVDLGLPRKWSKIGIFGHSHKAHLVRVVIARLSNSKNASIDKQVNVQDPGSINARHIRNIERGFDSNTSLQPTKGSLEAGAPAARGQEEDRKFSFANTSRYSKPSTTRPPTKSMTGSLNAVDSSMSGNTQRPKSQVVIFKEDPLRNFEGATFLPWDSIHQDAIHELDYSLTTSLVDPLHKEFGIDERTHACIPKRLSLEEVDGLVQLTKSMIDNGHSKLTAYLIETS